MDIIGRSAGAALCICCRTARVSGRTGSCSVGSVPVGKREGAPRGARDVREGFVIARVGTFVTVGAALFGIGGRW